MRTLADDAVSAIIAKWSAAFGRLDADALSSLYSRNAFFFGSRATLFRGNAGIASFVIDEATPPLSVKITSVIAREDGGWKITSHQVSSRTPLLKDAPAST
jgi:ketosteroid isomerase-like protein